MWSRKPHRPAVREIAAFVGADLADSATWYGGAPELDGIVPMHHAQSLWDIRQSPNLYQVFTEFFGTPRLMVDINRCIFRPPSPSGLADHQSWNYSLGHRPEGDGAGVVAGRRIVDRRWPLWRTVSNACLRSIKTWTRGSNGTRARNDFDFFNPGLNHWKTTQVEGKAGDVILWSTKLPHGTATNLSNHPRIAAFVTMQPPADYAQLRESLKTWWLTKRAPDYWRGMPGQVDPEPGAPAVLSELGLKLIGALPW